MMRDVDIAVYLTPGGGKGRGREYDGHSQSYDSCQSIRYYFVHDLVQSLAGKRGTRVGWLVA